MGVVEQAQQDLHNGRAGGREADVEQAHIQQAGHGERHGDADAERHKAEQERGQQTGDGVGFEISDIVR